VCLGYAVFDQPRDSTMNGHGGKRPGAGRPKGAASRANEEKLAGGQSSPTTTTRPAQRAARIDCSRAARSCGTASGMAPLDSITTVLIPHCANQLASRCKSSVNVPNEKDARAARPAGATRLISLARPKRFQVLRRRPFPTWRRDSRLRAVEVA
jgi:hypothetical protein